MLTKSSCPMSLQNTSDVPTCHQTRFFDRQVGRNIPLDVNPNLIDMNPSSSFASRPMSLKGGGRRCNNASRRRSSRNTKTKKHATRTRSNTARCDKKRRRSRRGGDAPGIPYKKCVGCDNVPNGEQYVLGAWCTECLVKARDLSLEARKNHDIVVNSTLSIFENDYNSTDWWKIPITTAKVTAIIDRPKGKMSLATQQWHKMGPKEVYLLRKSLNHSDKVGRVFIAHRFLPGI